MASRNVAVLQAVICVAWADGVLSEPERKALEGVLSAAQLSATEVAELRRYAAQPHTISELDIASFSAEERRTVVLHAVGLAFADRDYSLVERQTILALCTRMGIGDSEAQQLVSSASARMSRR